MATICPYPGRQCIGCPHRRIDEDYGAYVCFVKQDLHKAAAAPQPEKTRTQEFPKEKVMVFTKKSLKKEENWEALCAEVGADPLTTVKIKIYFNKVTTEVV